MGSPSCLEHPTVLPTRRKDLKTSGFDLLWDDVNFMEAFPGTMAFRH